MRAGPLPALVLALALAGCDLSLGAPPIELSIRDSLVGAGVILQIENSGSEALTGLEVEITAPDGTQRHFTQDVVDSYATVEIGWKKLGGWQIPGGSEVEIRADGYLRPLAATIASE